MDLILLHSLGRRVDVKSFQAALRLPEHSIPRGWTKRFLVQHLTQGTVLNSKPEFLFLALPQNCFVYN